MSPPGRPKGEYRSAQHEGRPLSVCARVVGALLLCASCVALAADPAKVLRLATSDIDTLDPQQWQDTYSNIVGSSIFEAMYQWDYFGRPPEPVPDTAAAAPEFSADRKTVTVRLQPGILFTDDPAFKGKPRELTADDYVYSIKRYLDPNLRGGGDPLLTDLIVGMRAVVDAARRPGARLDYHARVEGLRALDRHTLQLRLTDVNYPLVADILVGVRAVAREVVDAARGDIQARPVGTGPYRLVEWRRGTRVVLEANPRYRGVAFPASTDPRHADLIAAMQGKRLPQVGRIELSVIDEQPTRLLEFESGNLDYVELRGEAAQRLLVRGELDPALAARGIRRQTYSTNSVRSIYMNMEDPVLGGTGIAQVALRRAIALALDVEALIRVVYNGQGLPSSQIVPPGVSGFDPQSRRPPHDPVTANALLDRVGYGRRDAQNFRLQPDGRPLTLSFTIFPGTVWREIQTLFKRNLDAIGVRVEFKVVPTQDLFKEAAQGQFQMNIHGRGGGPVGLLFSTLYGPTPPEGNETRFRNAQYDRAFEGFLRAADEKTRLAHARTMTALTQVHVPIIPLLVDVENAFVQPWVMGYHRSPFGTYWKYLDIDAARRLRGAGGR
ncbi:MAG: bicyclomycin resistance protein [Betaproteobacteria bacterium]|jgi:ABC-type transport system substrate-binding protein|nr:bicyclomycin resistance protein [Betaproteobacteria bacterium]